MTWERLADDSIWEPGLVRVWGLSSGDLLAEEKSDGRVMPMRFEASERYAAAGDMRQTAIVVDLEKGNALRLRHRDAVVSALTFDPSGQSLVTAQSGGTPTKRGWQMFGEHELWVWSLPRGRRIATVAGVTEVDLLEFSPEGGLLIAICGTGKFNQVRAWKMTPRLRKIHFADAGNFDLYETTVGEIAFHRVSWWIFAAACSDGVVRIMEATKNDGRYSVGEWHRKTQEGSVESVAFLPGQGKTSREINTLASAGTDRTVREWHGREEITRAIHPSGVMRVRYTPDRRHFVTCTDGGGIYVWKSNFDQPESDKVPAQSLVDGLSRRLQRNLTIEEWRRYFGDESYRPTFSHLSGSEGKGTLERD